MAVKDNERNTSVLISSLYAITLLHSCSRDAKVCKQRLIARWWGFQMTKVWCVCVALKTKLMWLASYHVEVIANMIAS